MNCLTTILLFCCTFSVFGEKGDPDSFSADYFFSITRSNTAFKCGDEEFLRQCGLKCKGKYTCDFDECSCFSHMRYSKSPEIIPRLQNVKLVKDSVEVNDSEEKEKYLILRLEDPESSSSSERWGSPPRRHHIAHFCPNLDEARKCIRQCIKLDKPAFCGKDHICYCGHWDVSPV